LAFSAVVPISRDRQISVPSASDLRPPPPTTTLKSAICSTTTYYILSRHGSLPYQWSRLRVIWLEIQEPLPRLPRALDSRNLVPRHRRQPLLALYPSIPTPPPSPPPHPPQQKPFSTNKRPHLQNRRPATSLNGDLQAHRQTPARRGLRPTQHACPRDVKYYRNVHFAHVAVPVPA